MERITRVRAGILLTLFCLIVGFFALKLYDMQIIDTDGTVDNTKTFTTYTVVKAARGEILDRNGNKLVSNRASYDLVFNHYVIISASGTNDYLKSLVALCRELDIPYNDHFPVSKAAPFTYTLSEYNATWQGYFQSYLPEKGGLDSDISAPLLMKKLRTLYKIPEEWSEEDARAVIGLRYELDLRQGITNLPNYVFIADASTQALSAILELNIPGLKTETSTVREYNTQYAAHILGYCSAMTQDQWDYYSTLKDQNGNALYNKDAQVGQSGLEKAFEEYLHGVDGIRVDRVTVDGTLVEQYYLKDENGVEHHRAETLQTICYQPEGIENTAFMPPCWGCPAFFPDTKNGFLYIFSARYRTKRGCVPEGEQNAFIITKFPLPELSAGSMVHLTPADILDQFAVPSDTLFTQGGLLAGDKLIYTFGLPEQNYPDEIMVFDLKQKKLTAHIRNLDEALHGEELESCAIYCGNLMLNTCAGGIYTLCALPKEEEPADD